MTKKRITGTSKMGCEEDVLKIAKKLEKMLDGKKSVSIIMFFRLTISKKGLFLVLDGLRARAFGDARKVAHFFGHTYSNSGLSILLFF